MPAGRPPLGAELIDRMAGSSEAKKRVAIILQTIAGYVTIPQACLELDISESRFHDLRHELLQWMVQGAEAKPRGRPPAEPQDARVAQLQQEIQSLKLDLRAAQIREELATMIPHVLHRNNPRRDDKKNPDDPRSSSWPALDRRSYRHAEQLARMRDVRHAHRHAPRPMGQQGQQPHRQGERLIRRRAVAFSRWAHRHGVPLCEAARRLHMSPWTLGNWARAWDVDRLLGQPLGRPRQQASPLQCIEVTECLQQAGPTIGLPALHSRFPDLARSQLADLQHQFRGNWFSQKDIFAQTLEWLVPGTVWAVDFSRSPLPIDTNCRHILVVRDLASHCQLLALPTPFANATAAVAALRHLFTIHAPPLVLKSDNGSPFIAEDFEDLLLQWKVTPLESPVIQVARVVPPMQ